MVVYFFIYFFRSFLVVWPPSLHKKEENCPSSYDQVLKICPNNPVDSISCNDVKFFIARLNSLDSHFTYRLPTEAEWEYSARSGSSSAYSYGDDSTKLTDYAIFDTSSGTSEVAQKFANSFGLFDMQGNVWARESRGGGFHDNAEELRSANRCFYSPVGHLFGFGLRLVRTPR